MPSAISPVIEIARMMLKTLMGSMKLGFSAVNTRDEDEKKEQRTKPLEDREGIGSLAVAGFARRGHAAAPCA